jgi:3-hydroxyacyl-CoA dehydrogenase
MRWSQVKDHLALCIKEGRIPDDEPIVLKFPRQLAKKRIKNTEAKKRVTWIATPENYSAVHAARNYVIEAVGGNPVIADKLIAEVLMTIPAETWRSFEEKGDCEA